MTQVVPDGSSTLALIQTCDLGARSRVIRIDAAGASRQIAAGRFDGLLAGGRHPWAYQYPANNTTPERLDPLNGGPWTTLPAGFGVVGAYQDLIIGYQAPPNGSAPNTSGPLVTLNLATGRVEATIGPGSAVVSVSGGLILWTDGACKATRSCLLHRYDSATGTRSSQIYHLGLSTDAYLGDGLISPDRRLLAFQLHRPSPDPRFDPGHPGTPSDIAVLHLDTGQLETVPGVELWAKASPSLAFSSDSRWLIIGLDEGTHSSLLLWHPGLRHPAAIANVPGLTGYGSPITARLTGQ
ncbi:hypothetical protein M6D93_12450 [Jatrophihabitans telluris]|uniref:WD40 repeat domain-containing protein n=1 Tax=Jatrophihabitans telluris TaxID=2038343 RepID=A0ABY4QVP3_9ACTN|nr:hypothetical protein [Jatrophihabitans telluris]UQX87111.1 hypothetical protein M6D93_12450 [Jatrophihabitans telluris]